jgi:hypothetical protein
VAALARVRFTHSWGGYLGIPRDWVPSVWFDPDSRHARCEGYTGRGVATSALSASLLAAQVLGKPSSLEGLPFHRPQAPRWEVEPFRYYGVRYVQNAFARIDEAETAGERLPFDAPLASWLGEQ